MNNNHTSTPSASSDSKQMNHQTNGRVHYPPPPPRTSNSLHSNLSQQLQQQTPFIIDNNNNKNYSNLNFNQMMLNNQMMMNNPIFFQNHLLSQQQQQHVNLGINNNNMQIPITIIPNNNSSTSSQATTNDNSAVDVGDFALFQQEQAKQFSLFQQQQAAMFLQMAALQQQQQLETLANGVLGPYFHASLSNSMASYGGEDDTGSSSTMPMFIPTSTSTPSVNMLNTNNNNHNGSAATLDLYSSSPMKDSLLSSSPSNQMSVSVDSHSTNTDNDPENEDKRSQIFMTNQRRTGPVRRSKKGGWSEEEDEMLRRAVQLYGGKNWKKIAETLQNRTSVQCLHRWQKVLNPNLVKGPWTKEEDETILQLVKTYGAENWSMIASHLPGRIGKQCRERWYNHLDPNIKKDPWTEEEEQLLLEAQRKLGNKWAEISKQIPGRTDNACKNHFNSLIAREKKKSSSKDCATTETTTAKKTKKPSSKKDDTAAARSKHKRSLSDTVFYQSFKYEPKDSLLAPPTLSPMATSNNSGNNSPRSNTGLPPPHPSSQPNIFPTFVNPSSSNVTPFSLNFPFSNTSVPVVIPNGNIVQQNIIPLSRQNVQKSQDTPSQLIIPNIDITSPNSTATPSDLFHDASAFDATEGPNSVLSDVQDTLINQVGSSFTNFDNFEFENEVLIHENSNEEGSNNSVTSSHGQKNARPSTVFDEEMDFNDMDESELHNFLDEDDEDEQTNSGLLPPSFMELDSRQVKRKKFNHIFHNRSISFDVSQLQNKDQFF
ncbi:hypothetical protein C9374_008691 [Naegleria lovaniensis]|uniref:Myb transcription factor n=1 Tax=Naegleria lovaniensis TaxID=51637 RepID=A0AA88GEU3_NAELO|nr:uncharacterized protein C9374_008691 [Naegleria lovaniensis]KAG2378069.1 hypothetical protein C9374_008691 [Naegleria lovaniensis]